MNIWRKIWIGLALTATTVTLSSFAGLSVSNWASIVQAVAAIVALAIAIYVPWQIDRAAAERKRAEDAAKGAKVRALVVTELTNLAAGLHSTSETLKTALEEARAPRPVSSAQLKDKLPRSTPFLDARSSDLLALHADEVRNVMTLLAGVHVTRDHMSDVVTTEHNLSVPDIQRICGYVLTDFRHINLAIKMMEPDHKPALLSSANGLSMDIKLTDRMSEWINDLKKACV